MAERSLIQLMENAAIVHVAPHIPCVPLDMVLEIIRQYDANNGLIQKIKGIREEARDNEFDIGFELARKHCITIIRQHEAEQVKGDASTRKDEVEVQNGQSQTSGDQPALTRTTSPNFQREILDNSDIEALLAAYDNAADNHLPIIAIQPNIDIVRELLANTPMREYGNDERPYPKLLSDNEKKALLQDAENLWSELERNQLGGLSGINRPFHILHVFKEIIEEYGGRDVGLTWSSINLQKARKRDSIEGDK